MNKVTISIVEDEDGDINISVESDPPFPEGGNITTTPSQAAAVVMLNALVVKASEGVSVEEESKDVVQEKD